MFEAVLKYNAPATNASPSLSNVGSLAFSPKYLSSKLSRAARAASLAASAAVCAVSALVSAVSAFVCAV